MILFVLCIKLWMSLFKAIGDREAQTTPRGHLDTIKPEDNIPATCLHKSTVLCLKGMVRRGESWSREQSRWHVVWCVLCEDKTYDHHHGIKPERKTDAVKARGSRIVLKDSIRWLSAETTDFSFIWSPYSEWEVSPEQGSYAVIFVATLLSLSWSRELPKKYRHGH